MIDTVLFDFDGVIADSLESNFKWFEHAASVFNIDLPVKTSAELKESFIEPFPELYSHLGFQWEKDREEIYREYINYYSENPVVLVGGIKSVIKELSDVPSLKLGIVSSNEQMIVDENLNCHNLAKYFDIVVGSDKDLNVPLKPDPTSLLMALDKLGAEPSTSVYIGDQPSDMLTAQNASEVKLNGSMKTIAITTGFASRQKLEQSNPRADFIVDHPSEILPHLDLAS